MAEGVRHFGIAHREVGLKASGFANMDRKGRGCFVSLLAPCQPPSGSAGASPAQRERGHPVAPLSPGPDSPTFLRSRVRGFFFGWLHNVDSGLLGVGAVLALGFGFGLLADLIFLGVVALSDLGVMLP